MGSTLVLQSIKLQLKPTPTHSCMNIFWKIYDILNLLEINEKIKIKLMYLLGVL